MRNPSATLFEALGYKSQKRLALKPNTPENFLATFAQGRTLNPQHVLLSDWQSVDFIFQLTDEEVRVAGNQQFLFAAKGKYNGAVIESYLFFAVSRITREPSFPASHAPSTVFSPCQ